VNHEHSVEKEVELFARLSVLIPSHEGTEEHDVSGTELAKKPSAL
jgi:hypothetical protein